MIYVDLHMAQIQNNIYVFPKIHLLVLHVPTLNTLIGAPRSYIFTDWYQHL